MQNTPNNHIPNSWCTILTEKEMMSYVWYFRCCKSVHTTNVHMIRFSSKISMYFLLSMIPLMRIRNPGPDSAKQPHSMMELPPCSTVGMVLQDSCSVAGFHKTYFFELCPKSSILVSSDQSTLFHEVAEALMLLLAKFKLAWRWHFFSRGFLWATLPWRLLLWSALEFVLLCTCTPVSAAIVFNSCKVTIGLADAYRASLRHILTVILVWRPDL